MFDKLKNLFKKEEPKKEAPQPAPKKKLTPKELATQAGEPYVTVVSMDIDPEDINSGAFELDFNEIFVARLVKAGYMMKKEDTDADIVDRWFQNVCRHVVMETYEQEQAIAKSFTGQFVREKDIGDGRKEVS